MVFSSLLFLFRFMPVTFLLYYAAPKRWKNFVLLIASLFFYSWGEIRFFPIMVAVILVNYFAGLAIGKWRTRRGLCRAILIISLVFSIGWLALFKYAAFFITNLNALTGLGLTVPTLTLPLGISFYTFQIMTYTVDVYAGKVQTERSLINFGTFVVLFPQLIAGPIVKYSDISRELHERKITLAQIQDGIAIFILGLGSKVLIANSVGALWTELSTDIGFANISTILAWLGLAAFTLQIYFDFSGYSLMAIGLGKMLGFTFPQNFNYPYISRSVTEFWRRWHMTLSGWFKEYVYIPLGGSRCSPGRNLFNLFVVWSLTGLWHGAHWNFVLWGVYYFALLVIERMWLRPILDKHRLLSHIYAILAFMLGWALFAIEDFGQVGVFFGRLFIPHGGTDWIFYLRNYAVILVLGIFLSTPALKKLAQLIPKRLQWICIPFLGLVLVLSIAYLVDSTYNPFLYWNF